MASSSSSSKSDNNSNSKSSGGFSLGDAIGGLFDSISEAFGGAKDSVSSDKETGGSGASGSSRERQDTVAGIFEGGGLSKNAAAALAGVAVAESGGKLGTGAQGNQKTDKSGVLSNGQGAFGIFSWNGDRQTALSNFARDNQLDVNKLETQAKFTLHEINTNPAYSKTKAALADGSLSVKDMIGTIVSNYTRPASYNVASSKSRAYQAASGLLGRGWSAIGGSTRGQAGTPADERLLDTMTPSTDVPTDEEVATGGYKDPMISVNPQFSVGPVTIGGGKVSVSVLGVGVDLPLPALAELGSAGIAALGNPVALFGANNNAVAGANDIASGGDGNEIAPAGVDTMTTGSIFGESTEDGWLTRGVIIILGVVFVGGGIFLLGASELGFSKGK
jgi:hypothetical protein